MRIKGSIALAEADLKWSRAPPSTGAGPGAFMARVDNDDIVEIDSLYSGGIRLTRARYAYKEYFNTVYAESHHNCCL